MYAAFSPSVGFLAAPAVVIPLLLALIIGAASLAVYSQRKQH